MTVTLANSSTQNWRDRAATDFYPTPAPVTQALLNHLMLPKMLTIWEPACGEGHMVKVLRANGYVVRDSDIQTGTDFLEVEDCPESFIITNPPFNQAEAFIRHANKLNPECGFAFLLKSQYWHSASRLKLFREIQPQFVLPLTWRPDFLFGAKSGSPTMEVLWTVWINIEWEECYEGECIYHPSKNLNRRMSRACLTSGLPASNVETISQKRTRQTTGPTLSRRNVVHVRR